jgi:upstream activation factor subunit UAF30
MNADTREFCAICGVILSDVFFRCLGCEKIHCTDCHDARSRRCVECGETSASEKRVGNGLFMRPLTPSSELASVVGPGQLSRAEVTKKLWEYIKREGLQDKANKRMINADEKLSAVFGGKLQVSMFEMTKLVAKHLK